MLNRKYWVFVMSLFLIITAYIYPADFLLSRASQEWNKRPSMRVEYVFKSYNSNGTLKNQGRAVFVWNDKGVFEAQFEVNGATEKAVYKGGKLDKKQSNVSATPHSFVYRLFGALADQHTAFALLKEFGIAYKTLALTRFEGEVCHVIGAKEDDLYQSQLWLSKQRRYPMRLIVSKRTKERIDIRFLSWKHPLLEGLAPAKIEIYANDHLAETLELFEVKIPYKKHK